MLAVDLSGVWALGAAGLAAGAGIYASFSGRKTARGAQALEQEKLDRSHEAEQRALAKDVMSDLQAACDRCVEDLRLARSELVKAYQMIGQYQEKEQRSNQIIEELRKDKS